MPLALVPGTCPWHLSISQPRIQAESNFGKTKQSYEKAKLA